MAKRFEIIKPENITPIFIGKVFGLEKQAWETPCFPNIGYKTEVAPNKETTKVLINAPEEYYESRVVMSEDKRFVRGYMIVDVQSNKKEAEIYDMAVNKNDFHREAIGSALIREAEEIALAHKFNSISFTTHLDSETAHHNSVLIKGFNRAAINEEDNTVTFKKDLRPNRRF